MSLELEKEEVEVGKVVKGKIVGFSKSRINNFYTGAFVLLPDDSTGRVDISEVKEGFVKDIKDHLQENQEVKVKVLSIDEGRTKIRLSIKKAITSSTESPTLHRNNFNGSRSGKGFERKSYNNESLSFEDKLAKFMKDSDEKLHDLKKSFESKRGSGRK